MITTLEPTKPPQTAHAVTQKSVYMLQHSDNGCLYHRFLCPARFVPQDAPWLRIDCQSLQPMDCEPYDAYMVHGLLIGDSVPKAGLWKWRGGRLVWSVDDDWLSVPEWNPARPHPDMMGQYQISRDIADHILCSTEHLADTFTGRYANKTVYAPNLMDLSQYPTPEPQEWKDTEKLRIVWCGSQTHARDVDVVVPALQRTLDRFNAQGEPIEVIFIGQSPPPALNASHLHKGVYGHPPVALNQYWTLLAHLIRPHIWLAPLAEVPFNLSKSAIRVYEGWALSAATLATDWGEYGCIRDGEDGFLCKDPDDWERRLGELILDKDLREGIARNGRRRAEQVADWNNPRCREPWVRAFSKITGEVKCPHSAVGDNGHG